MRRLMFIQIVLSCEIFLAAFDEAFESAARVKCLTRLEALLFDVVSDVSSETRLVIACIRTEIAAVVLHLLMQM